MSNRHAAMLTIVFLFVGLPLGAWAISTLGRILSALGMKMVVVRSHPLQVRREEDPCASC